jgi:hypothetical protein
MDLIMLLPFVVLFPLQELSLHKYKNRLYSWPQWLACNYDFKISVKVKQVKDTHKYPKRMQCFSDISRCEM